MLSPCWGIPDVTQWFWWSQLRGWCLSVSVSCADLIRIPYFSSIPRENFSPGTLEKYGIRIKSAHGTGAEGQQPRSCGHQNHYVTSGIPQYDYTCAAVYWCRGQPTTFNILYDGISIQRLATVLISVFTLCYGPGLLFRGPCCNRQLLYISIDLENLTYFVIWEVGECGRSSEDTEGSVAFRDLWQVITAVVWCVVPVGREQQLLFAVTAPHKIRSDGLAYELSRCDVGFAVTATQYPSPAMRVACHLRPPPADHTQSHLMAWL